MHLGRFLYLWSLLHQELLHFTSSPVQSRAAEASLITTIHLRASTTSFLPSTPYSHTGLLPMHVGVGIKNENESEYMHVLKRDLKDLGTPRCRSIGICISSVRICLGTADGLPHENMAESVHCSLPCSTGIRDRGEVQSLPTTRQLCVAASVGSSPTALWVSSPLR